MSQTNHICVSLDFYGIDRHLESRLGPTNSAEYKTSSGGRGGGGERGSGGAGERGRKEQGRQIFLRTVHFYSLIYHVGLYMKKEGKTKAKRRKDKRSSDLFAILVCFEDALMPNTDNTQFHDVSVTHPL